MRIIHAHRTGRLVGWVPGLLLLAGTGAAAGDKPVGQPFTFATVTKTAQDLAKRPFQARPPLPDVLARLTYDQYRLIAFRPEDAVWRRGKLPFWVEFAHRGFVTKDKVDIFLVEDGVPRAVSFDPGLFQYRGEMASLETDDRWGFGGLRLLCRLPERPHFQEFCSFQGASYFRAVCTNQVYGASARGLAIDIGLARAEEFPSFRTLWIERPAKNARSIRAWALLDGPSVTGAYAFLITPGLEQTTLDIECRLFFRRAVERLGIAPMSSMWANARAHDSDGLLIAGVDGEWLWRPLEKPARVSVSRFAFDGLKGFGLMQRDRDARHYRDDGAEYSRRPSVWIKPRQPWGKGAVEMLEVPTDVEWTDNIAAWWVPKEAVRAGETMSLAYQVAFAAGDPPENRGGRFVATNLERQGKYDVHFTLLVESAALRVLPADALLQPVVTTSKGRIVDPVCTKNSSGVWKVRFRLARDRDEPAELRAFVKHKDSALSETWSFLCP